MALPRSLWTAAVLALIPAIGHAQSSQPSHADVLQTMQAFKRLQEDDLLGPLNVGVKVRGRIAVLWGPVPTADLAARAERRLRGMIELIDVRNELIVMPEDLRDVPVPQVTPAPLFLPEKAPPPLPNPLRLFLRLEWEEPGTTQLTAGSIRVGNQRVISNDE